MPDYEKEYKALLKRIADIEDTIIKLKRNLKDELENLDIDNFSESFKVKQDKASLEIKRTAKELSVKMEDYDTSMLKMQSEINQTAGAISLKVTKADVEKMISNAEFTVDVDGIKSEVKKYADEQISTAAETITAESITQTVSRAFFEVEKIDEEFDGEGKDPDKIYYSSVNRMHYYYNSISDDWKETSSRSIYSAFIQTDDGFEFNGDVVKISGDLITEGTISADRISTDELYLKRLYASYGSGEDEQCFSFALDPKLGDMGLYKSIASEENGVGSDNCLFGVRVETASGISMWASGYNFLKSIVTDGNKHVEPLGEWDFSAATVFFEDDGVNAIAVFG